MWQTHLRLRAAGDPGHGPSLRITHKRRGKTVTEALPNGAVVRKAEREIAECVRLATSKRICRKKTAVSIQQEVSQEVSRILAVVFAAQHKTGGVELEALEISCVAPCIRPEQRS